MRDARGVRRIWAERIVIVIAAVASIATSPRRWSVEATPPPPAPGKAMAVTLEASEAPNVWIVDGPGGARRLADVTPAWQGRARYFVPAGARIQQIEITGRCSTGLCAGKCKPPDTAHVRVTSATAVDAWIAEDRSAPVTTVLVSSAPTPSYRVTIEASRLPIALEIDVDPRHLAPEVRSGASGPVSTFYVDWHVSNAQTAPATVSWTARATIQGECAGTGGCTVPAGEAVRIRAVEAKAPDAP